MSWKSTRFPRLIQLRIDDELYAKLTEVAERDKTTVSELIRSSCRKHVR